jgi:hypothetical protein
VDKTLGHGDPGVDIELLLTPEGNQDQIPIALKVFR